MGISIELILTREAETQSNFSCDAEFHYPQTLERFDDLIEDFKLKTIEDADSINETKYDEDKTLTSYCYGRRLWFSPAIKDIR